MLSLATVTFAVVGGNCELLSLITCSAFVMDHYLYTKGLCELDVCRPQSQAVQIPPEACTRVSNFLHCCQPDRRVATSITLPRVVCIRGEPLEMVKRDHHKSHLNCFVRKATKWVWNTRSESHTSRQPGRPASGVLTCTLHAVPYIGFEDCSAIADNNWKH